MRIAKIIIIIKPILFCVSSPIKLLSWSLESFAFIFIILSSINMNIKINDIAIKE